MFKIKLAGLRGQVTDEPTPRTPAFAVGDIVKGVANAYDCFGELGIKAGARYRVTGLPYDGAKLDLMPLAGGAPRSAWPPELFRRVKPA